MNYGGIGSKKNFLVWDTGIGFEHARRLGQDGNSVRYFSPWQTSYPKFEDYVIGSGFESENLQNVMEFFPHLDWADCVVGFDVGIGALLDHIRKTTKKPVYGSSLKGDRLENDREFMRSLQEKMGLPVQKTEVIVGIPKLREYLKRNPKKYIKISVFRSDMESLYAKDYDTVEGYLDHLEVALGPFNETYHFVVEESLDEGYCEPGYDCYFGGKDWVKPMLWGMEQSKESYVGVYMDELPKPLMNVADKFKKVLSSIDYRSALSVEVKLKKDGTAYLLDVCSRYPFPLSAGYCHSIKNYSEVIWKIAQGKEVKLDVRGKYIVAMPIYSSDAEEHYVKIDIPKQYKDNIRLRSAARVHGQTYGVKGSKVIAVVSDCGNDFTKVIDNVKKMAGEISAFKVSDEAKASLDKIAETLEELPKYGLTGFEKIQP